MHSGESYISQTETALDELERERRINCLMRRNPGKILHCVENNTKTFNLNGESISFFDFSGDTDDYDNYLSNKIATLEELSKIVTNPPAWLRKAVGAHANTCEVVSFMRQVLRPEIEECTYSLVIGFPNISAYTSGNSCILSIYGDSSNGYSFSTSETIVAHELYHGITAFKVGFYLNGMAGAICESYSDIFAVIFKNRERRYSNDWDWRIGAEIDAPPEDYIFRDLSNPSQANQADSMDGYREETNDEDNFSLRNSGIHNYAAFNIINNLLRNRDNTNKSILEIEQVANIFYNALFFGNILTKNANFNQSYLALLSAASSLFEKNSSLNLQVANIIRDAFTIVNVI